MNNNFDINSGITQSFTPKLEQILILTIGLKLIVNPQFNKSAVFAHFDVWRHVLNKSSNIILHQKPMVQTSENLYRFNL